MECLCGTTCNRDRGRELAELPLEVYEQRPRRGTSRRMPVRPSWPRFLAPLSPPLHGSRKKQPGITRTVSPIFALLGLARFNQIKQILTNRTYTFLTFKNHRNGMRIKKNLYNGNSVVHTQNSGHRPKRSGSCTVFLYNWGAGIRADIFLPTFGKPLSQPYESKTEGL